MFKYRFYIINLLLVGGVFGVFFFSWLPNPNIGLLPIFPSWLGKWINVNGNLRTAVPFVGLGSLGELYYVGAGQSTRKRITVILVLLGILLVAELGQLYLPRRHFDWADIAWGLAGSVAGMGIGYLGRHIVLEIRKA